jgi:hypothetical protein
MTYHNLPEIPDGVELEKPLVAEGGSTIVLSFTDPISRAWWTEFLRGKRAYEEFGTWVDGRR